MLVAPMVVQVEQRQSRPRLRRAPVRRASTTYPLGQQRAARTSAPQRFLIAWAALGLIAWLCIPAARSNSALGATVPFWLVVAPLLDLMWLKRGSLWAAARDWMRALRESRNQPRWPSRLRSMRRRNSSMMRRYRSSPR
jgi:hypothetical protein